MSFDKDNVVVPGWYFARDVKSIWWNLFVHITHNPPFQCVRLSDTEWHESLVHPEEIKQVSTKQVSLEEFKVIQLLQKVKL